MHVTLNAYESSEPGREAIAAFKLIGCHPPWPAQRPRLRSPLRQFLSNEERRRPDRSRGSSTARAITLQQLRRLLEIRRNSNICCAV